MAPSARTRNPRAPPGAVASEVADRRSRALEEPLDARLLARTVYPLLEVRNPVHKTAYLVMFPEFPSFGSALCTCTDFARRGLGTCKHLVAAERWLRANPDAPTVGHEPLLGADPTDVWREVDQRLDRADPARTRDIRAIARPGAALFEVGPVDPGPQVSS